MRPAEQQRHPASAQRPRQALLTFHLLAQLGLLAQRQLIELTGLLRVRLGANANRLGSRCTRGLDSSGGGFARIALHEHAFLAHFDLDRARLARGIRFLDLCGLLARERDPILRLACLPMRFAQVIKKPRFVLIREQITFELLGDTSGPQLLEQYRGLNLQLAGKLGNTDLGH